MHKFGKVVLSRKGFDSSAGGGYSPFDPQTGKYVVLPIPDGEIGDYIGNGTRYEQIRIKPNYLDRINASTLKELINSDALRFVNKKAKVKEAITNNYAHFDPWLGSCPWLSEDSDHHIGAFGQEGRPQGHLCNQHVREGSLFLFYSRFVPIEGRKNNLGINIGKEGAYFLYGWLKVKGPPIKHFTDIANKEMRSRHPHATQAYFNKEDPVVRKKNNTIYIADELLFPDDTIPGCGYFLKLSKKLLLTSREHLDDPTWWELPGFFYSVNKPTYLRKEERWHKKQKSSSYLVQIPRRGQEFVFDESGLHPYG